MKKLRLSASLYATNRPGLSFTNVSLFVQWIPEVEEFCPRTPFIVVGCKGDVRHSQAVLVEDDGGESKSLNEEEVSPPTRVQKDSFASFFV